MLIGGYLHHFRQSENFPRLWSGNLLDAKASGWSIRYRDCHWSLMVSAKWKTSTPSTNHIFAFLFDTGLIYLVQRSRDLVWKTTLDISLNIQLTSHQNGGSLCQILIQTTRILYADSIYQSKFYLEVSVDTFVDPPRLLP